jgi:uncharacterized membrane protein
MKRSTPTIGLYLLLVFISGAVVGGFGHRLYSTKSVGASSRTTTNNSDGWRERYLKEMNSRLQLTSEQTQRLVVILDESKARYKSVRDRMDPEMKQIQQEQRNLVRQMLSPEQRPEYEKMLEERERLSRERGPRGGGL